MNMQALRINFHMNDIYAVKTFFFCWNSGIQI